MLSFVTTLRNLADGRVPDAVREAYLQYFFGNGFPAVDGTRITSPVQLAGLDLQGLADLRTA